MAFSTQKDFFHVPFMNENVQLACPRACVNLKTYESSIDDRSWARDEAKRSKFLSDLVTCQFPVREGDDEEQRPQKISKGKTVGPSAGAIGGTSAGKSGASTDRVVEKTTAASLAESVGDAAGPRSNIENANAKIPSAVKGSSVGAFVGGNNLIGQLGNGILTAGDSLLQCANVHLADYQKMMNIKVSLEKQLDVSNERLKTAHEEIHKIKEILNNKLDSNTTKDFHNKIQKFVSIKKFTKDEENEMIQIYQKMENMHKGYEVLQAENNYLCRLIEKLSARVNMDRIKQDPEKSTDVQYLQNQVNTLRKECTLLRSMEDDYHKIKQNSGNRGGGLTDQDAQNIKAIIKERNTLREKCKSFKAMETTVVELEHKYKETDKLNGEMSNSLHSQASHIKTMECEMQKMQKYYEKQLERAQLMEQCLKAQLEDLKDDLVNYKCQAQKVEILQTEVACLRNEVLKRDMALSDYDCQYKQLMFKAKRFRDMGYRYRSDTDIIDSTKKDKEAGVQDIFDIA